MKSPKILIAFAVLSAFTVLAGCSSTVSPPVATTRVFTLSASSVDFGDARMGLCADATLGMPRDTMLAIHNSGNDTLHIDSVTSQMAAFSVLYASSKVAPGDTGSIHVRFCPSATGSANSSITMNDNSTNGSSTIIALKGNGIRYYPFAGSLFNYMAIQMDSAGKTSGNSYPTTGAILSSGLTYQGKTEVALTSDSTYFHIEDNGDVSVYSTGFPIYPYPNRTGAGWLTLPTQSHVQKVTTLDTTYDSAGVSISLNIRDSVDYRGDSTITVGTKVLPCSGVIMLRSAHYSTVAADIFAVGGFGGFFSPEIGFSVAQLRMDRHEVWARMPKPRRVNFGFGGEEKFLTSYSLK